jgi:hypothetical protein
MTGIADQDGASPSPVLLQLILTIWQLVIAGYMPGASVLRGCLGGMRLNSSQA